MSLLNEIKSTVVQAQFLSAEQVFSSQFPNSKGYYVITGYIEPRDESELLIKHNVTDDPLQIPPNMFPIKAYFVPSILLESPDLNTSNLELYAYDDTSFSNSISFSGGSMTGTEANSKGFSEMCDVSCTLTDFTPTYPYLGMSSSGDFTAGRLQVYVYLLPCSQPL